MDKQIFTPTEVYNKTTETISLLIDKYKDNEYMLQRIQAHVTQHLPTTLETESTNYEKRTNRTNYLTKEQELFIQVFLSKNKYFHLPNNNFFYEYDGKRYLIVKEDDIIHKLLSTISSDRVLMEWKHKTKANIIRKIKERNLFHSIPETNTIQNVLNVIYPYIFATKNEAKFFLTILGDNILKKPTNNLYFVSPKMKQILNELNDVSITSIGCTGISNSFIIKYHESHSYENYRLIKMNDTISKQMWRDFLKKIGLDLLCVAAHYSKRYENAEKFIHTNADDELKAYTYYFKNHSITQIVGEFCSKYLVKTETGRLEWRNLHFVWKQFLADANLQSFIFVNPLKSLLKERYDYDETGDVFLGITSKYLPSHSDFIRFWEDTIIVDLEPGAETFAHVLEMDELCALFKMWSKNAVNQTSVSVIHETNIVKILTHFFPEIKIVDDKYVLHVTSKLWDKIKDIESSFSFMKEQLLLKNLHNKTKTEKDTKREKDTKTDTDPDTKTDTDHDTNNNHKDLLSLDDAYNYYYRYCNLNSFKFVVNKSYFDKYICYKLADYIEYEKFIQIEYFLQ
jgi:hypothetical protein